MFSHQRVLAGHIGELEPGKLSMRAPVRNDVVQLNLSEGKKEFCVLNLIIEPDIVRVSREDTHPLQVEVQSKALGDELRSVLVEPADEVVLSRSEGGYWLIGPEGLQVQYMGGFELFTDSLVNHALIKQAQTRQPV